MKSDVHATQMSIEEMRSPRWQDWTPSYRVDFWEKLEQPLEAVGRADPGYVLASFKVRDTSVDEVLAWAEQASAGRIVTIYLCVEADGELGLIRLFGTDPTRRDA